MYTVIYGTEETPCPSLIPALQEATSRAGSQLRRDSDGAMHDFFNGGFVAPEPAFEWPEYLSAEGYGTISKPVYDVYVAAGGTMSDKQAFDGYNAYALDEWNGCEGYSTASGNSPYHWGQKYPQAESFAEWLEVERVGGEHKYNWRRWQ